MPRLTLPAPAKLNLFLLVTGRRPDGYHSLQTLFQFIDLADTLHIEARADGQLTLSPALPGVCEEDNLILRAARLLKQHSGCPMGADITLEKRLPMGGGIGGGSSDAASTLLALNALWGLDLPLDTLAALGLQLGADVPVFVHGHAAWAEGVGEQLTPVDIPEPWYLLAVPPVSVSTAEIFSHGELTRHSSPIKMAAFLGGAARNDCEAVVRKLYPDIDNAMKWLDNFGVAKLTGTGACIFAAFATEAEARAAAMQVPPRLQVHVTRGINRSPAHTALASWKLNQ